MERLQAYFDKTNTDPGLGQCLIDGINGWRQGNPIDPHSHSQEFQHVLISQAKIGWQNLLEGAASKTWHQCQASHYAEEGIRKSSKRWSIGLHKRLHQMAWHQWKHRNDTKFVTKLPRHKKMVRELNDAIMEEYQRGTTSLLPSDRHHLRHNIATLLRKSVSHKQSWIANVTTARLRYQRIQQQNDDLQNESRSRSKLLQWIRSGRCS